MRLRMSVAFLVVVTLESDIFPLDSSELGLQRLHVPAKTPTVTPVQVKLFDQRVNLQFLVGCRCRDQHAGNLLTR